MSICPYWDEEDCEICTLSCRVCHCGADVTLCEFPQFVESRQKAYKKIKEDKDVS